MQRLMKLGEKESEAVGESVRCTVIEWNGMEELTATFGIVAVPAVFRVQCMMRWEKADNCAARKRCFCYIRSVEVLLSMRWAR